MNQAKRTIEEALMHQSIPKGITVFLRFQHLRFNRFD